MKPAPIGSLMVVDDDKIDQMLYQRIIRRSGLVHRVESFYYAQDAIDYLSDPDNPPTDLILLDINMPRMSGLEFLREATSRFGPQFAGVVVVMLTSSLNPSDEQEARSFESVKGFYSKPLTDKHLEELANLVNNA